VQGHAELIANRVGVFSILATFHHHRQFGLGFDEVDALTGSLIGPAKSAPTAPRTWSASIRWRTSSTP